MSNSIMVRPEGFEKAVLKAISEYGDHATEITEKAIKSAARGTTRELKGQSPANTGQYARGWSHKAQKGGPYKLNETVYNRTDGQLTHLLEKPHPTGGGGHYPKYKDYTGTMARIEEEYTNKFMEEVMSKL